MEDCLRRMFLRLATNYAFAVSAEVRIDYRASTPQVHHELASILFLEPTIPVAVSGNYKRACILVIESSLHRYAKVLVPGQSPDPSKSSRNISQHRRHPSIILVPDAKHHPTQKVLALAPLQCKEPQKTSVRGVAIVVAVAAGCILNASHLLFVPGQWCTVFRDVTELDRLHDIWPRLSATSCMIVSLQKGPLRRHWAWQRKK